MLYKNLFSIRPSRHYPNVLCEDANNSVVNIAVLYHLVPKMIQNSGTVSPSTMHKPQTPVLPSYLHFSFLGRASLKLFQRCLSFCAMKYGNS
jgi:hypothetical protein